MNDLKTSAYKDTYWLIPGQAPVSQFIDSALNPTHFLPPPFGGGLLHFLLLVLQQAHLQPSPGFTSQFVEQSEYELHGPHFPSTSINEW